MAKEVKNRRENLFINENPPEVFGISDIEAKISTDGFVKNTDYPTNTKSGVLKLTANTYGVRASADGQLYGAPFTLAQYNSGSGNLFVTKTTLENVIASLITKMFVAEADPSGEAEDGTSWDFKLYKQSGEYIWLVEQHLNP